MASSCCVDGCHSESVSAGWVKAALGEAWVRSSNCCEWSVNLRCSVPVGVSLVPVDLVVGDRRAIVLGRRCPGEGDAGGSGGYLGQSGGLFWLSSSDDRAYSSFRTLTMDIGSSDGKLVVPTTSQVARGDTEWVGS